MALHRDGAGFIDYRKGDSGAPCKQTINYYQWVPYMLVLQGLLFMLPHRLWKHLEEGKMKCIAEGVTTGNNGWGATSEIGDLMKQSIISETTLQGKLSSTILQSLLQSRTKLRDM